MKKLATLTVETEECDVETDEIRDAHNNKTINLIKNIKNCKSFVVVSVLFLCITIILTGIMTYFCLKLKNNALNVLRLYISDDSNILLICKIDWFMISKIFKI